MLRSNVAQQGLPSTANGRHPDADSVEQVREERRGIRLPAFANLANRSTVSLTIIDLSYDGCKVETPVPLSPGSCMTLSVLKLGVLQANVRWCREGLAGLCFSASPKETKPVHPRAHDRVSLQAAVSLRRQGSMNYIVRTTDVSPSGCKVEFVERPCVGDTHWIKFDGLEALEVVVRWVQDFSAGVKFSRAIHPAVFAMLITRLS